MFSLVFIVAIILLIMVYRPSQTADNIPIKISDKLDQLWEIVQESISSNRYLRAEKALLTILRIDEKNSTAYNRLGILYAKQKAFKDAIECFEIAQSLEPSASSLHNVGLIYFETEDYAKSALAFEQAIELDNGLAARHIAYAKTLEKLGNNKKMIESLERAVELEPIPQTLNILAEAYQSTGQTELSTNLREKAVRMLTPEPNKRVQRQPKQPRKIIM